MSTTTTKQAEAQNIVFVLNKCIETSMDGEKGYAAAAADVRDPSLKSLLQQKSKERADFVRDLQSAIQKLGAFAENEGTARGTAHRGWMDVRLALGGRNDRVIVEEWARECVADDGQQIDYSIPRGVHINVQEGERVGVAETVLLL